MRGGLDVKNMSSDSYADLIDRVAPDHVFAELGSLPKRCTSVDPMPLSSIGSRARPSMSWSATATAARSPRFLWPQASSTSKPCTFWVEMLPYRRRFAKIRNRRSATPLPCRSADAAGDCVGVFTHQIGARYLIKNPQPAAGDAALRMPVLHRRLCLRRRQIGRRQGWSDTPG